MAKVAKLIINHRYTTLSQSRLIKGEIIPFDIFIKRYKDFVIIIEAGTFLDESLYFKLSHHLKLYISNHDLQLLREYSPTDETFDAEENYDPIAEALLIKEKSAACEQIEERVTVVYSTVSKLMESIFVDGNESLPLGALRCCAEEIVDTFSTKLNLLPIILKLMPDEYSTHHHSVNVAYFATILGIMVKFKDQDLFDLTFSALLHDIGKMRIDTSILDKPYSLDEDEFESIKHHSQMGCDILEKNGIEDYAILSGILHHHERLDGSGYPDGVRGKVIPQNSRIIGVCDVFDALTTTRTFRDNYSSFEALLIMKREMHKQFDERLIDLFIELHR